MRKNEILLRLLNSRIELFFLKEITFDPKEFTWEIILLRKSWERKSNYNWIPLKKDEWSIPRTGSIDYKGGDYSATEVDLLGYFVENDWYSETDESPIYVILEGGQEIFDKINSPKDLFLGAIKVY